MVLGAEVMALLKSMIVLPLTSSGLGFHLLGLPTGDKKLAGGNRARETPPQKLYRKGTIRKQSCIRW